MNIASEQFVTKKLTHEGVEIVNFADDKVDYVLDNHLPSAVVKSHEIYPASFWHRWFFGESKEVSPTLKREVTPDILRSLLSPRYVRHFLLEDATAKPSATTTLNKQAKKLGVANIPYSFPDYDCGDRSFACMGAWHLNAKTAAMATYIVWVTYVEGEDNKSHALNAFCDGYKFYLYEPATYEVFDLPEFWMVNVLIG